MLPDFEGMFIDQYAPLDDKNIAQDKLQDLRQCGTIQEYITKLNNIMVALPD